MADTVIETAPAQPIEDTAPPAPVSATIDAANRGDFSDFQRAKSAERNGKPLEAVAPAPEAPKISNRQKAINDAVTRGAESATATLREENARLKAQLEGRQPAAAQPTRPAQPAPTTMEDVIRRPDVSKPLIGEAEFFAQFPDAPYGAHARYASNYDRRSEAAETRQRGDAETVDAAQREQIEGFVKQLRDAEAADPTFRDAISPLVGQKLKPFTALADGEESGPINVIGEQVYASDVVPQMLKYFSTEAGEAELRRITTMPPRIAKQPPALRGPNHINWMIREYGKLEARVQGESHAVPAEAAPAPRTTTALEPPPPTISRARSSADPIKSALARDDFGAFQREKRAERLAKRGA